MIQEALRKILTGYVQARQQQAFPGNFRGVFEDLRQGIAALPSVQAYPGLKVRAGFGIGKWSQVPWACIMDPRISASPQEGVFVNLKFRQDMAGFYMTLNQGHDRDIRTIGRSDAHEKWQRIAAEVRSLGVDLPEGGFHVDGSVDLGLNDRRAADDFRASTIAWRYHSADSIPGDAELDEELGTLLRVYQTWLAGCTAQEEPLDIRALEEMRQRFLRRMSGFRTFALPGETYLRQERTYKVELSEAFRSDVLPQFAPDVLTSVEAGEAAINALHELLTRRRFGPGQWVQNLVNWRMTEHLQRLSGPEALQAAQLYSDLLYGAEDTLDRAESFSAGYLPILARYMRSGRQGVTRSLPTLLLMLAHPEHDIFVRTSLFRGVAHRLLGHPLLTADPLTAGDYAACLRFVEQLRRTLESWGWQPKDMIDIQSFLWVAGQATYGDDQATPGGQQPAGDDFAFEDAKEPGTERRIYKIAPGEQARYWDECRQGSFVCVGWDEIGDLREFTSEDEEGFVDMFRQTFPDRYMGTPGRLAVGARKAKELWLLRDIQPGDIIMATRGVRELLALGEVIDPGYEFDASRDQYKHLIRIRWNEGYQRPLEGLLDPGNKARWMNSTIAPVDRELYAAILERRPPSDERPTDEYIEPQFSVIVSAIRNSGMRLSERMIRRYHAAVKARGFVILAGASGTGKTWLAETYADAIGARFLTVRVAPNWNSNEDLLGYLSPITGEYQHTAFSRFLIDADKGMRSVASAQIARPFHVLLDEMNLARVEHYFADFLSALEQRNRHETATLSLGGEQVTLHGNLVFVGTVNMDETTHGFAHKVYDRAQLLEVELDPALFADHVAGMPFADELKQIRAAVANVAPIAFRTADDIEVYVRAATAIDPDWQKAFDEALLQKVLPRIRGIDPSVGEALQRIIAITEAFCPLSHDRAKRMLDGFRNGAASFF